MGYFLPTGEGGGSYTQAAVSIEGVVPEPLEGDRSPWGSSPPLPIVPLFLLPPVGSDLILFCHTPGSDSAQSSYVSLMAPKDKTLDGLKWEGFG